MPAFPALIPSSRTFTPGEYPGAMATSLRGTQSRVAHSSATFASRLQLTFVGLTQEERFSIEAHYHGQGGGFRSFELPAEMFSGLTDVDSSPGVETMVPDITYWQSSIYGTNAAATFAGMTNGVFAETTQTGTHDTSSEYVAMDLGSVMTISKVVIGCDFSNTLAGGWGAEYTENRDVEGSTDSDTWSVLFNTGTFTQGIQEYAVNASVQYVRIVSDTYLAVTEFYAMTTTAGAGSLWRYVAPPEAEDFCGPHHDITVTLESVSS